MGIPSSAVGSASEIGFDQALEEVEKMTDVVQNEYQGVTIYSGVHPQHGPVHVVVPGLGGGVLLFPFVIRDF